jgi:hypothetical protein
VRFADDTGRELGTGIVVDQADNVYATGYFLIGTQLGPFQLTSRGSYDIYVARLDTDLNVLCANQLGGAGADGANGIAVDNSGFLDTTGAFTGSGNFALPPNAPVTLTSAGDTDVFVSRQRLECHVHVTVVDSHILQLQGDDASNRLVITDDRNWTINVAVNDDPAMTFTGIDQVVVATGNGRNSVAYQVVGPDVMPADLTVRMGDGDNTLLADAHAGWGEPPSEMPWHIDISGGAGVERSTFLFGGPVGNLDLQDQLGKKQNTIDVRIENAQVSGGGTPVLNVNFLSGGGMNSIHAGIVSSPETPVLGAALFLRVAGTPGNDDRVSVDYRDVTIAAPQVLALTGVQGGDSLRLELHNALVNAPLAVGFAGPGGDPGSTVAINDVEHMPVPLDGSLTMSDRGGPFEDDVRVIYAFNPQSEPPGMPSDLHGAVEFHVPRGDPWGVLFELTPPAPGN